MSLNFISRLSLPGKRTARLKEEPNLSTEADEVGMHSSTPNEDVKSDGSAVEQEKVIRSPILRGLKKITSLRSRSSRHGKNATKDSSSPNPSEGNRLLSGEQVFITLDNQPIEGMVKIAERRTFSPLNKGFYRRDNAKLAIYTYPEVQAEYAKVKLSIDGYLKLGMKKSLTYREGPVVLLGGGESPDATNLEILTFSRGQIIEVSERQLPERSAHDFLEVFEGILEALKQEHTNPRFIQAAPLNHIDHHLIDEYVDHRVFQRVRLTDLQPSDSALKLYGPPLLIGGASVVYYAFILVSGYTQHAKLINEVQDLQRQLRNLTQNEVSIEVLEAREQFKLNNERSDQNTRQVSHIESLAQAVGAIPGGEIRRIRTPGDGGTVAELTMAVPEGNYPSPLIQGRDLLDSLVYHSNGYSMRLSQSRGSESKDGTVVFNIEVINGQ